jgi:hypothetical protein
MREATPSEHVMGPAAGHVERGNPAKRSPPLERRWRSLLLVNDVKLLVGFQFVRLYAEGLGDFRSVASERISKPTPEYTPGPLPRM